MMQSQDSRKFPVLYFMVSILLTYTFLSFYGLEAIELEVRMVDDFLHVSQVFSVHVINTVFKLQTSNLSRKKYTRI